MEYLGLILALLGVFAVFVLIVAIFMSFIASRIFSLIFAALALVVGIALFSYGDEPADMGIFIADVIITALAWLFHRGPAVFDRWWDGSFEIRITEREITASPKIVGGFISNAIAALLTFAFIYYIGLSDISFLFLIVPVFIIIVDIISFRTGNRM